MYVVDSLKELKEATRTESKHQYLGEWNINASGKAEMQAKRVLKCSW